MGTRCATVFNNATYRSNDIKDATIDELFRFYRHWDGYPEGHGMDLADAIIEASNDRGLNNRNWCQHVVAHLFAKEPDMEVEPHGTEHGDLEFLYMVSGRYDHFGGKVNVTELPVLMGVWDIGWDESYDVVFHRTPLFLGTAQGYKEWVAAGCPRQKYLGYGEGQDD